MGLSVNPNLKRCPFRWQCPVSSPTTHLNWSLFNFNRSFVLLAEGPGISPFAFLSPIMDSQYFLWFLFVQSLTAFLANPTEMPQAGLGPVNWCSDPVLASWSTVSFPTIPSCPGTHISWTQISWSFVCRFSNCYIMRGGRTKKKAEQIRRSFPRMNIRVNEIGVFSMSIQLKSVQTFRKRNIFSDWHMISQQSFNFMQLVKQHVTHVLSNGFVPYKNHPKTSSIHKAYLSPQLVTKQGVVSRVRGHIIEHLHCKRLLPLLSRK
jgi:hypothetical protein